MYLLLKFSHLALALASISGFATRGYWMLTSSPRLAARLTRIAPHIVDTLFLASGIALVLHLDLPVMRSPWLLAKLIALVIYVVSGSIALRRGSTLQVRAVAFVAALAAFAYIVGAALSKSPASWLAFLTN